MTSIIPNNALRKLVEQVGGTKPLLQKNRTKYWENNKINFEKNIKLLISHSNLPTKWNIWFVASHIITDKTIMPYDLGSWSTSLVIVDSPKQGHEMLVFYNEARIGFMSLPAMIPIFIHELFHTFQADKSAQRYFQASLDDEVGKQLEIEAEKQVSTLPTELLKQAVLETILYSFDKRGWDGAQKAIDFYYIERPKLYSGGYAPWITEVEYNKFENAKKENAINLLINTF